MSASSKGPEHSEQLGKLCASGCGYCDSIRAMVADLPPLAPWQVQRVARVLRGG